MPRVSPMIDQKRQMLDLSQSTNKQNNFAIPAIDLLLAIVFLESAIWFETMAWRSVLAVVAFVFFARCLILYAIPTWTKISECRSRMTSNKLIYSDACVVVIASFVLAGLLAATFFLLDLWSPIQIMNLRRSAFDWIIVKIPTVIVQQLAFQLIVLPTIYFLTRSIRFSIVFSAIAFGLFHLPNPVLMVLTTLIGLVWFAFVFRFKALIPITISHLVLALAVGNVAEEFVFDMRVGPVCFQKWPYQITAADKSNRLSVYPRLLYGNLESVTQTGNRIELMGHAFDRDRNKPPAEILVVFGSYDPSMPSNSEDLSTLKDDLAENWIPQRIVSVKPTTNDGVFHLQLTNNNRELETEIRLFARHRNGWAYPIHGSTRVTALAPQQSIETICLHPREFEANIGHFKKRKNRVDAIGWGFSLRSKKLIDKLLVKSDGQMISVPFERRTRNEIADTFEDKSILQCGFVARLDSRLNLDSNALFVRNSRGMLEQLPQRLQNRTKTNRHTFGRLSKKQQESEIR